MKKLFFVLLGTMLCIGVTRAQEDDYSTFMYETIYLTPIPAKIAELNAGLSAHNKKYHGEGDYSAWVQSVLTGRHTGEYVWGMGPGNFARLDSRPAANGHDDDWNTSVMPYISEMSNAEYWVRSADHNYTPEEDPGGNKIRIRFYRVKRGQNQKFSEMFTKIVEVFRSKGYNRFVSLYWNNFPTARGRNAATVSGVPNWAMYDEDGTFVADFESVHGEGTFEKWLEEWRDVTEWVDNEIRQTVPELGGTEVEN